MARAVREFELWLPGELVLAGVSGGADSTALLAALTQLPSDCRPQVRAAHFDHGLRGSAAAAADARAVADLCARVGVPVVYGKDSGGPAEGPGGKRSSPEAAARQARYTFLGSVAALHGARVVAVGQHRDDRAETVVLRLLRGAGARGLAGMRPRRALAGPGAFAGLLVRPLWYADRAGVLDYLRALGLGWVEDETNVATDRTRNLVRHVVLPALDHSLGRGYRAALLRTADNLAADEAALRLWAERESEARLCAATLSCAGDWWGLPEAIRQRVLQRWWEAGTAEPALSRQVITNLLQLRPGGVLDLPAGRRAICGGEGLILQRGGGNLVPAPAATVGLAVPGVVNVAGVGRLQAQVIDWPDPSVWARVRRGAALAVGDAADLQFPLAVRPPSAGERVVALGAGPCPRRVRDLLRGAGVPPGERRRPRLIADGRGVVLWVAGVRPAAAFAVNERTRRALLLVLEPEPPGPP